MKPQRRSLRQLTSLWQKSNSSISHKGGIDNLQPGQFSGWVITEAVRLQEVRLLVGDHLIARGEINQPRPDVNAKFGWQGTPGFCVELPSSLPVVNWQGLPRIIAMTADGKWNVELSLLGRKEQATEVFRNLLQSDLLGLIGHCDGIVHGQIRGWAAKTNQTRCAEIWMHSTGEEAIKVVCDLPREGMEALRMPKRCGFAVDIKSLPDSWNGKKIWFSFDKENEFTLPQAYPLSTAIHFSAVTESFVPTAQDKIEKTSSHSKDKKVRQKRPDITFAANLHQVAKTHLASSSAETDLSWLPAKVIEDAEDSYNFIDKSDILAFYLKKYHASGISTLSYLRRVGVNAIEKAIQPYFDSSHYTWNHSDLASEPPHKALHHYAVFGGLEDNRTPNPLFYNLDLYDMYPWTRNIGVNALYLFTRWPEQFPKLAELIIKRFALLTNSTALSWQQSNALSSQSIINDRRGDYQRVLAITRETSSKERRIKTDNRNLNVHFVVPDFSVGGGGHMTIFRLVYFLETAGHSCTVWIKDYGHERHPEGPQKTAHRYLHELKAQILPLSTHFAFAAGDALIATSWDTVSIVKANLSFHEHFYLVQDYEPFFYARGSEALEAEHTYTLDIKTICASKWLHNIMTTKFHRCSTYFDLSFDRQIYAPKDEKIDTKQHAQLTSCAVTQQVNDRPVIRLAFYARSRTERRAVSLALKALALLRQEHFIVCVEMFGEEQGIVRLPSNVIGYDNGVLTQSQLAELYRSCDIGLTFSSTNYALVPQEMMACGLPVIEIDNESTRAIYPDDIIVFAIPTAESIASAIADLACSHSKRKQIAEAGREWVNRTSWDHSFAKVEGFIREHIIKSPSQSSCPASVQSRYLSQPHHIIKQSDEDHYSASIIIPTYQGGELLQEVIERVQSQQGVNSYEVIIVDSSSTDGSIKDLQRSKNLSIIQIEQKDFQHGRTRNLGIALSKSPYVAFLTQDAIPANKEWLANLIEPLKLHEEVDAVFGSHRAHTSHPAYLDNNLRKHFEGFEGCLVYSKHLDIKKYHDKPPFYRQFLHYYSDNNSCLRKEAWNRYPYHDVSYGEDQLWADWIILTGRSKSYASKAVVYHSHNYTPHEEFERSATESHYFMKYFGYWLGQSRFDIEDGIHSEAQSIIASKDPSIAKHRIQLLDLVRAKREGYRHGCELYDLFMETHHAEQYL